MLWAATTYTTQLDNANARTNLFTSDDMRLPHVSVEERGNFFGQANDTGIEASQVCS